MALRPFENFFLIIPLLSDLINNFQQRNMIIFHKQPVSFWKSNYLQTIYEDFSPERNQTKKDSLPSS